jgi:hypothetical protein
MPSLSSTTTAATAAVDQTQILQIGADIATGLAYLHPSVVHRDLKVGGRDLDWILTGS